MRSAKAANILAETGKGFVNGRFDLTCCEFLTTAWRA